MFHFPSFNLRPSQGFSIVEVMVAVGLLAVLGLGAAGLIAKMSSQTESEASQRALVSLTRRILTELSERKSTKLAPVACTTVFSLDSTLTPAFNGAASAKNNARLLIDGTNIRAGAKLTHPNLTVSALYVSDNVPIGITAGGRQNYLSTLYLTTDTAGFARRPREVGTMSLEVDTVTGQITQCHVASSITNSKDVCDKSFGMRWNAVTSRCEQAFADDATVTNFNCPPGFKGAPPNCLPIPSTCASGQIARGFRLGQVKDCSAPPTNIAKNPRPPEDLTRPPNDPAAPPAPGAAPVQPTFAPPAAVNITTSSAGSPPSTNCTDGTAVTALSADACNGSSYSGVFFEQNFCTWPTAPAVATSCDTKPAVTYQTPDLSTTSSDAPAPADGSCQCNNRRIANGDYCMYCIQDADLGYGFADYSYGVSQCNSGNLVDSPAPQLGTPVPVCNNTYSRARYSGGKFYQYSEIP
jgi:type II secretory pathway pseudopilin PulG